MDWIDLFQDRDQCRAFVKHWWTVGVHKTLRNSWVFVRMAVSQEGPSSMGLISGNSIFFPLWVYRPTQALATSKKLSVSFQLLDLGQPAGLLGQVISSLQGLYMYTNTEECTQNENTKQPCPEWDSIPRLQHPRERRQFMPYTAGLPWPAQLTLPHGILYPRYLRCRNEGLAESVQLSTRAVQYARIDCGDPASTCRDAEPLGMLCCRYQQRWRLVSTCTLLGDSWFCY
jgi:hypothetical protein